MSTDEPRTTRGPQDWAFALFLVFGAAQIVAGIIFFFAYNWRALPDAAKIAAPQAIMIVGFLAWAALGRGSRLGDISAIIASVMIGVSMAVVGQVYQLGADPWRLFAFWAAIVFPVSLILRSDAQLAVALTVASIGYFLYTDENILPTAPQAYSLIPALFAVLICAGLILREVAGNGPPSWLRWLMAAAALAAALFGAIGDIFSGKHPFEGSFGASLTLLAISFGVFSAYRYWKPDKPTAAMALFALAAFAGALGLRFIFLMELDGAGAISFALFLGAGWIVAMTAALAAGLRRLNGR